MPRPRPTQRPTGPTAGDGVLTPLAAPFANPGALRMLTFVPGDLPADAPLVVVLHGCTQTAAGYDAAAGWSRLAAAHGFALLLPEQVPANNPNRCFTWFESGDTRRGAGEVASIAAAVAAAVTAFKLDPARVFVTGLSAGGAMASVCLAAYPDVFAGGAIIAGLPAGAASGLGEALSAMASPAALAGPALGDKVRGASTFTGPWPRVSVWHGGADRTVARANGAAIAAQWADVHDAVAEASEDRTVWRNAAGVAVVEFVEIDGMGHGTPVDGRDGDTPAAFMLDVGIGSSAHIAAFWGIAGPRRATAPRQAPPSRPRASERPRTASRLDVGKVIADALRAAGMTK